MLSSHSREALKKVSAATLTTVLFKRGFRNAFIQNVFLLNKKAPRMVGEAYTLRYIPAREDLDQLGAFEGRGHPQREAIEACPPGQVLVMDARRDATAATGGDILMTRLMVRGAAGVVVIPAKFAEEVAAEAAKQTEFEDWVEAKVKEGRSIFGLYPPDEKTRAEFEAWKKKAK